MEYCASHPERNAIGACVACGKLVCTECRTYLRDKIYCNPCADKRFSGEMGNTSGQGSLAMIPEGIRGWNWGAFLLNWIWGVGNSVWIALLALIPYLGFIMVILLGVKGNEWAWRYKKWDSIEHFKRTQSTWTKWAVGLTIASLLIGVIWAIVVAAVVGSLGKW
ncbi:B-box zinc finger protein [Chloroflexota bacterium]